MEHLNIEEKWCKLRNITYEIAEQKIGLLKRRQRDWFNDNIVPMNHMLEQKDTLHKIWLSTGTRLSRRNYYNYLKEMRRSTRRLKDEWFQKRAQELCTTADRNNTKKFYDLTKELDGPSSRGFAPLSSKDGTTLLTEQDARMQGWKEHFSEAQSTSEVDTILLENIEQSPVREELSVPPSLKDVKDAISSLQNGKSPGEDALLAEIFKHGGCKLQEQLHLLILLIWKTETTPKQFRNAEIVTIFKNKGTKADCSNYRGVSLLSVAGKILTKILHSRIGPKTPEAAALRRAQNREETPRKTP